MQLEGESSGSPMVHHCNECRRDRRASILQGCNGKSRVQYVNAIITLC